MYMQGTETTTQLGRNMRPCLVLIDLQQDFLNRPGLIPEANTLIRQVSALLEDWRSLSLPVIHVHTIVSADGHDRIPHWKALDIKACVAGSPGALAPSLLAPQLAEQLFCKQYYSAVSYPGMLPALRAQAIDTLILAGIYSHACVHSTVVDAYQHGFRVWVAADGIGSDSALHDDMSRAYLAERACTFLTASEIIAKFQPPPRLTKGPVAGKKLPSLLLGNSWMPSSPAAPPWTHYNPSDQSAALFTLTPCSAADVNRAAVFAANALPSWSSLAGKDRSDLLAAWKDAIEARRDAFVFQAGLEIGKPPTEAQAEFDYALALLSSCLKRSADQDLTGNDKKVEVRYRPLGCVGVITPWNNPLAIAIGKLAPALLFGNTVLWKPALPASGIAMLVVDTLKAAGVPGNIVNVVFGGADTAKALVFDRNIKAVTFTGSSAVGRRMAILCADRGIPLQAELGGNNGVIVTPHCHVAQLAATLANSVFSFSGQRCTAPRRLIVERAVMQDFTGHFIEQANTLKVGHPHDPLTRIGPLISRARTETMAAIVADALTTGGKILCGGGSPSGFRAGCWFEPTLVVPGGEQDRIVQEESFGPIGVILPADDFDDALRQCNAVQQGLVATLCSDDPAQQNRFLAAAAAGILRIGAEHTFIHPEAPFGGWKVSGLGVPEHGRWDRDFYTRPQAIYGLGR